MLDLLHDPITAVMIIGFAVAALGVLLLASSTRWVRSWGNQYVTTNRTASCLGWALLAVGLAIAIGTAMWTGQLQ